MSPQIQAPLFGLDVPAPFRGNTSTSKASSASGAVYALTDRKFKIQTLRTLWTQPLSMQEMARQTGWPLASICSLKAVMNAELHAVGQETVRWPDGRTTQRTIWRLRKGENAL